MNLMHPPPSQPDDLLDLIDRWCDGTITAEQMARLESLMRGDAGRDARRLFLQYASVHAELACSDGALLSLAAADAYDDLTAAAAGEGELDAPAPPIPTTAAGQQRSGRRIALLVAAGTLLLAITVVLVLRFDRESPNASIAVLNNADDAQWDGPPPPRAIAAATLRLSRGTATLRTRDGATLVMIGPATLEVRSATEAVLHAGRLVAGATSRAEPLILHTPSLRIRIDDAAVYADVDPSAHTELTVREGAVVVTSRFAPPRHYWSFDEPAGQALSRTSQTHGQPSDRVRRAPGIIGPHAVEFDDHTDSVIDLGQGGGDEPGKGEFSVTDGLTLEALIISRWSGKGLTTGDPFDYDEIFRKDDGAHRLLLSFQNDDGAQRPTVPPVPRGPCLAFGLYVHGHGYSELDMPLDGLEGRPTVAQIADGKPHHIVATYDAATGLKAIYIDGVMRFSYRFTTGAKAVSGGLAHAVIGNWGVPPKPSVEPFHGLIDELAFYDYALTERQVAAHYANVQRGLTYFGLPPDPAARGEALFTMPLAAPAVMRFDSVTGSPIEPLPTTPR